MTLRLFRPLTAAAASLALVWLLGVSNGCTTELFRNQIEQRSGNIAFVFINTTPFRAAFSFGTFDSLDRAPGPVSLQQLLLEGGVSSSPQNAPCRRNAAIGTREFVDRVLDTDADNIANFIPDALAINVNFSSAPADSDLAALPTEGTATGREVLLGVDYTCGDQLIFTFVQDPDAAGGFRIDFEVLSNDGDP